MNQTAIYIHVPFCDHKCIYCDFYSIITSDNISGFLQSLKKEILFYSERYSEGREIISIYFGGGTPSLLQPDQIGSIISEVKKYFTVSTDAEITMETNPGTVTPSKLAEFKDTGINRLSIGIQSFDDQDLKFLTRIHDSSTAKETVINAKQSGFNNVSIDLIFNLPGQTLEKWLKNLNEALKLPIKHISAYSLILERGTILNKMVLDGKVKLQDDDYDADLYRNTISLLSSNGFSQYEVSNFAQNGFECIHNLAYWTYKDYIGLGPSAHSFVDKKRWWNFSSLRFYMAAINQHGNAERHSEILSSDQMLDEYIMLSFRSGGINFQALEEKFGGTWLKENYGYLEMLKSKNLIRMNSEMASLTADGYAVCDEIVKILLK